MVTEDSLGAVIANGMLNSLSAVIGIASTLAARWDALSAGTRDELVAAVSRQVDCLVDGLGGIPADSARRAMEHLVGLRWAADTLADGERVPGGPARCAGVMQKHAEAAALCVSAVDGAGEAAAGGGRPSRPRPQLRCTPPVNPMPRRSMPCSTRSTPAAP